MKRLELPIASTTVSTAVSSRATTTTRTNNTPRNVVSNRRTGPLQYLDQALRDTSPQLVCQVTDLVRRSVPDTTNALVCLSIRVGEAHVPPKCKSAGLVVPKLVVVDTKDWTITLNLVCNRDEVRAYMPQIDTLRTAKTLELALEEVAGLWCGRGPFRGRPVSLLMVEDLICELVKTFAHHLLDAIALVRMLVLCQQEEPLRRTVARLLLDGGSILDLIPTTTALLAQRRILDGERIAMLDLFSLRIIRVRGNGIASLAPPLWCIQPVMVLETVRGTPEREEERLVHGTNALMLFVVTVDTSRKVLLPELSRYLTRAGVMYCRFALYDSEDVAGTALVDLERYITAHHLREEMQELGLDDSSGNNVEDMQSVRL